MGTDYRRQEWKAGHQLEVTAAVQGETMRAGTQLMLIKVVRYSQILNIFLLTMIGNTY